MVANSGSKSTNVQNCLLSIVNRQFLLTGLFFLFFFNTHAQIGQDLQLADQYFNDGEYEKAATLYDKLYDNSNSDYIYSAYLKCLLTMKDFGKAEKIARKQIKKTPGNPEFGVDLGYVYSSSRQPEKARSQYEKVLKQLNPSQSEINRLANRFLNYREMDLAIETYTRGKKLLRGSYSFNFELAELYFSKKDYGKMIGEYFEMLEINPTYLFTVENNLQSKLENDSEGKNYDNLRKLTLKKIQSNPNQHVFTELLLWYFVQLKDFESAFVQAKSLDLRLREDGQRLMNLADLCLSNEDYESAVKSYNYVISKGESYPFYLSARMNLLAALNKKITSSLSYSKSDLLNLESDYLKTLQELGKNANTVQMILGLAHLQAFYLGNPESARKYLLEAVEIPQTKPQLLAAVKLELGDILLFMGDVWESTLLYFQVEKSFKEDPIGQEAKFRNARLSFYNGEFEWSLAQLDVLKSATSQLIANDAMSLALIITDNTAFDTTTDALMMYARADLYFFRNMDSLATASLDSILREFSNHPLADDAWYKKYLIKRKEKQFEEAAKYLQIILDTYFSGILADDALYNLALLNETVFKNSQKAKELYQKLLVDYPSSTFVVEARKRFRALRGDQVN